MKEPGFINLKLLLVSVGFIAVAAFPRQSFGQPSPQQPSKLVVRTQVGMPFSAEERSQIVAFTLNHPMVASLAKGQQVKALTVTSEPDEKQERAGIPPRRLASVVFFNYTSGQAFRAYVDLTNSEVVQVQPLAGRPPASEEELQEARQILQRHSQIKQLLDRQNVIEGGFIVDPPRGSVAKDRFIQFHILSPDRQKIEQVVIVDLTAGQVASTANFGATPSRRQGEKR